MTNVNGLAAFELLSGLDDDLVTAAILPEDGTAVIAPTGKKRVGEWISDFMSNGWAAAVLSAVISLAVLVAIIRAGQISVRDDFEKPVGPTYGSGNEPVQSDPMYDGASVEVVEGDMLSVENGGQVVYPIGYPVWRSDVSMEEGEYVTREYEAGAGAVGLLGSLKDLLPRLSTQGGRYTVSIPDHMTLDRVRVFKIQTGGGFAELDLPAETYAALNVALTDRSGDYIVVLEITSEIVEIPDYWESTTITEYAFRLTVDGTIQEVETEEPTEPADTVEPVDPAGVWVTDGTQIVLLSDDYDIGDGSDMGDNLRRLYEELPVLTSRDGRYRVSKPSQTILKRVRVFDLSEEWDGMAFEERDSGVPDWLRREDVNWMDMNYCFPNKDGEYVIALTFYTSENIYEGAWSESAFRLIVDSSLPEENDERDEAPCITVSTHTFSRSDGYPLWEEFLHDGEMLRGEFVSLEKRLLNVSLWRMMTNPGETITVELHDSRDTLTSVVVCDAVGSRLTQGTDPSILSELDAGVYFVILSVRTKGDYVPEADAYEASCYEYAFILDSLQSDDEMPVGSAETADVTLTFGDVELYFTQQWDGCYLWSEFYEQGSWISSDGMGAEKRLNQIIMAAAGTTVPGGVPVTVTLKDPTDTLTSVTVTDLYGNRITWGSDVSILSGLEPGTYGVVLKVVSQGEYIEEKDAFEKSCYEYPMLLWVDIAPFA